jgi:beta-lactamase superfamily II metal-dependent hydrolase
VFSVAAAEMGKLVVNVISVGHGDAIFIEFPNGASMLVDGGMTSQGDSLARFIKKLGYSDLDYVVVTHTHPDHLGGLLAVLDSLEVGALWMSTYHEDYPLYAAFTSKVESLDVPVTWVARNDTFKIGDVSILILNPAAGSSIEQLGGLNNASIVMRLEYGTTGILLAADIDSTRDRELVGLYGDRLQSRVLKCAHHGSEISSSAEFLTAVSPRIAILSTGTGEYGYPSDTTMARIEKLVPTVYRTDHDGTIIVTLDGKNVTVKTQ